MASFNKDISPKSLTEAIQEWNQHKPSSLIISPHSEAIAQIGKTILIHYSKERGYWISKAETGRLARLWNFLSPPPPLQQAQQKEVQQLLNTIAVARRSIVGLASLEELNKIHEAQIRVMFGDRYADAYALMTSSSTDKKEMNATISSLSSLVEEMEDIALNLPPSETETIVQAFKGKVEEHLNAYTENFRKEFTERRQKGNLSPRELMMHLDALDAHHVFAFFYAKLLDRASIPIHLVGLAGLTTIGTAESMLEDLTEFQKSSRLNEAQAKQLQHVLDEMRSIQISCVSPRASNKERMTAAEQLFQRLQAKGQVMMYGGARNHGVLYKIEKTESGQYRFTVINTGAGGNKISVISPDLGLHYHVLDVVYDHISAEQMTPQLFLALLDNSLSAEDMLVTNKFLDQLLLRNGVIKTTGRERIGQEKGTCAVRCIMEWLREDLGDLYPQFEVSQFTRAIALAEAEIKKITHLGLQFIYPPAKTDKEQEKVTQALHKIMDKGKWFLKRKLTQLRLP